MLTIAKFILPDARRAPRADSSEQDEESKGLFAVGRALVSQWYDGNDDWQRQFVSNDKILPKNENQPYLTYLAGLTEDQQLENEIESFMLGSNPDCDIWDRHAGRVQSLIEGDSSRSTTTRPSVPRIWVWDPNYYSDRPGPNDSVGKPSGGKQLSTEEFFEFLRKERLPETHGSTNSPPTPRRIYINNPSGNEIQELTRQLPASQAEGFRELLAKYVHDKPRPYIGLRECTMWNQEFSFHFNCPYYVLTTEDVEDHRTFPKGKQMRSRESLDFLYPSYYRKGNRRIHDLESPGKTEYIHDVVASITITGKNDDYWNCFFFNEDLCLEAQKQRLQADTELHEDGGSTDPITMGEQTVTSLKPRVYGLQALATQFGMIVRQQESIVERFEDSFARFNPPDLNITSRQILDWGKKFRSILTLVIDRNSRLLKSLDTFLFVKDVRLVDGIPNGRLFQSLKRDRTAMRALRKLADLRQDLENANQEFERLRSAYEDFRRERKDGKIEEENSRYDEGQNLQQLIKTIAALQIVLTLLALAVQVFDAWDPSQPVAFAIMVMLIAMICIIAFIYFFWWRRRLRRQHASRSAVDEESGCVGDEWKKQKSS